MRNLRPIVLSVFIVFFSVTQAFAASRSPQQGRGQSFTPSFHSVSAPKKIVAVSDFDNKANIPSNFQLGRGMADMLTDALIQSGQFVVVERQALDAVLAEQNLASSGRTTPVGGAKKGAINRAQILVQGAITEYEVTESGGEQSIKVPGGNLKTQSDRAHIAIVIRLIDTTTSQVLASQRVEGSATRGGLQFELEKGDWGFGNIGRKNTPIDKAVQIAIDNAVNFVSARMATLPWRGKVIKVTADGEVYLNAGSEANLSFEKILLVYRQTEEIIDPDSGLSLGFDDQFVGTVKVTDVYPKFAIAKVLDGNAPIAGDALKVAS